MEYCLIIKSNDLLVYLRIEISLKNVMLSERSWIYKII